MKLLTKAARAALVTNAVRAVAEPGFDPPPVIKLFNPMGAATWLASELGADGDILFGLADLGFGCPELGYFSLSEIAAIRLPFGLRIERDLDFASTDPLSRWAEMARLHGSIIAAEAALRRQNNAPELPSGSPDG
ncbi:DUF2958 domain-containing protein [Sphingomonas koreensis]